MTADFEVKANRVRREVERTGRSKVVGKYAEEIAVAVSCLLGCDYHGTEGVYYIVKWQ